MDKYLQTDRPLSALKKYFGYSSFKTDVQENAIREISKRKQDAYVSMPTGSGKSLCFQLPGLMCEGKIVIVFSPLLALIEDQIEHLRKRKIMANSLNSRMSKKDRDRVLNDLKNVKTETKFLYITPEQTKTETFKNLMESLVKHDKVAFVAVDEAHCISQWGHDFRPDYKKLGSLRAKYSKIPWIALTATAPAQVKDDIIKSLSLRKVVEFRIPCFRKNLMYDVVYKNNLDNCFIHMKEFINDCFSASQESKGSGIIYCRTRQETETVAAALRKQGVSIAAYHAGLKSKERTQVQEDWMANKIAVICATISFGMGVDKASVRFVIHWEVPQSIANYYQESGRAGRDGKKSFCRIYYGKDDVRIITFLIQSQINKLKGKEDDPRYLNSKASMKEFENMIQYCEKIQCRHKFFADFFGDPPPACKDCCDVCRDPKKVTEALTLFHNLNFKTTNTIDAGDYDLGDLYEGGRSAYTEDYYEHEGDGQRSSSGRSRVSDQTFSLIRNELKKRRGGQDASSAKEVSLIRNSKVKAANSTSVKVNGLKVSQRESFMSMFADLVQSNVDKTGKEITKAKLSRSDYERIGAEIEYKSFSSATVVTVYRRNISKDMIRIKKQTTDGQVLEEVIAYKPLSNKSSRHTETSNASQDEEASPDKVKVQMRMDSYFAKGGEKKGNRAQTVDSKGSSSSKNFKEDGSREHLKDLKRKCPDSVESEGFFSASKLLKLSGSSDGV